MSHLNIGKRSKLLHIATRKSADSDAFIIVQNVPVDLAIAVSPLMATMIATKPDRTQMLFTGQFDDGIKLVFAWLRQYAKGSADIDIEFLGPLPLTMAYRMLEAANLVGIIVIAPYVNNVITKLTNRVISPKDLKELLRYFDSTTIAHDTAVLATASAIAQGSIPASNTQLLQLRASYPQFSSALDNSLETLQQLKKKEEEKGLEQAKKESIESATKAQEARIKSNNARNEYFRSLSKARRDADKKYNAEQEAKKEEEAVRKGAEVEGRKMAAAAKRDADFKKALYDPNKPFSSKLFPTKRGVEDVKGAGGVIKKNDGAGQVEEKEIKPVALTFFNWDGRAKVVEDATRKV